MNNLFAQSRSHWVRYDRYELKTAADGKRYITPNARVLLHQPHGGVIVECAVGLAFLGAGIQGLQHGFRHTGQDDFFHL